MNSHNYLMHQIQRSVKSHQHGKLDTDVTVVHTTCMHIDVGMASKQYPLAQLCTLGTMPYLSIAALPYVPPPRMLLAISHQPVHALSTMFPSLLRSYSTEGVVAVISFKKALHTTHR